MDTGQNWTQRLPEVLAGMRMLQTKMGLSPYMLTFK